MMTIEEMKEEFWEKHVKDDFYLRLPEDGRKVLKKRCFTDLDNLIEQAKKEVSRER